MKGVVMNLLADMVETQLGMQEWNDVLDEAGEDGVYTATSLYEDERLLNLVGIISRRNDIPVPDLVFAFGQFMFPAFYDRYPQLIDGHANMLEQCQVPGAVTPGFSESRRDDKTLHLTYTSERKLCGLADPQAPILLIPAKEHGCSHQGCAQFETLIYQKNEELSQLNADLLRNQAQGAK